MIENHTVSLKDSLTNINPEETLENVYKRPLKKPFMTPLKTTGSFYDQSEQLFIEGERKGNYFDLF